MRGIMSRIVIRGGRVITPVEERFTDVVIDNGVVESLGNNAENTPGAQVIDAAGCYVTPGLIDLQVNGAPSCNFWGDPTVSDVANFAEELVKAGVTTILPTLITDDLDHLRKNIDFLEREVGVGVRQLEQSEAETQLETAKPAKGGSAAKLKQRPMPVRMPGIHLEGPCLSPERPGVHPKQHIQPLSVDVVKRLVSDGVKLITCAPETDASGEALAQLRAHGVEIALGHSNATYEEAKTAFDKGVKLMTHTFNALPPIHHRAPGAVTAALLDNRVMCCLICDGHHVSAPAAELVIRIKGVGRVVLVTDVAATGTSKGGLVGSSILMDEAVRNVVKWGIATFTEAIIMSTLNPAKAMGWDARIGILAPGKQADLVVWDQKSLKVRHVIAGGRKVV
jgi:N-acetylglucosamine-6-phosphate deacetylase